MNTTLKTTLPRAPLSDAQKKWLQRHLRRVLAALYDPGVLRTSPLLGLCSLERDPNGGAALRRMITDSIESLRPGSNTPTASRSWRMYQILRRRYTEQITQQEVALDLGLSVRQLQREDKAAREILLDYLLNTCNISERITDFVADEETDNSIEDEFTDEGLIPSLNDELTQLQEAVPARPVDIRDVVEEVLHILSPLIKNAAVEIIAAYDDDLPKTILRPPMLRQALLNIFSTAIRCSTSHSVRVSIQNRRQYIVTEITAQSEKACELQAPANTQDSLAMAEKLVQLCKGTLTFCHTPEEGTIRQVDADEYLLCVKLVLPATEQVPVLIIDDNTDVLQLFQRYLTGSPYRFMSAQSAPEGLQLTLSAEPEIIVLDVMMPDEDGWTLLGRLREHPDTAHIPVIICSILTQEDLALALGAADYLRKPVNRQQLLAALNRQSSRLNPTSD